MKSAKEIRQECESAAKGITDDRSYYNLELRGWVRALRWVLDETKRPTMGAMAELKAQLAAVQAEMDAIRNDDDDPMS